jgi:hypothetical protein
MAILKTCVICGGKFQASDPRCCASTINEWTAGIPCQRSIV